MKVVPRLNVVLLSEMIEGFFSMRSQAFRNWSISLLQRKFPGLEFLLEVLMRKFLPGGASFGTVA
ncbi:hypothetical protein HMPREF9104_00046 [Lentilactobacillus kisonensis F0435]|uniref:Uncharacterized protein n=1 Tax=Lentilactobacillus kisonensis F0435 TaxID=797516 RepID=H1LBT6_9LACO|nr:hypothetical protein HMPREF9104_00046 [Lentilactobacillus kisonensis F0435]